jgi:hypothetical protein
MTEQTNKTVDLSPLLKFKETRSQLVAQAAIKGKSAGLINQAFKKQTKKTYNPETDGVDHINFSSCGKTSLGKLLDINARSRIHHPQLGLFESLGGIWYYLCGDQNDMFRSLFGRKCNLVGKKSKQNFVEGFRTIIAEASWIKVIQNPELIDMILKSDSPFVSYFIQGEPGIAVLTSQHQWYAPVLEEIRKALKKNQQITQDFVATEEVPTLTPDMLVSPNFDFIEELGTFNKPNKPIEKKKFSKPKK